MPATTQGAFNATKFRMEIGTGTAGALELISNEKEVTISFASEKIDTTSKDSVGWSEFIGGLKSWSGSGSGLVNFEPGSGKANVEKILAEFLTGDRLVAARFSTDETGDIEIEGTIFLDSIEITGTMETACEFSFNFTGSGAPTLADVSA